MGGGLTYRPSPRRSKAEAKSRNLLWRNVFRIYRRVGPTIEWHSGSREGLHPGLRCLPGKEWPAGYVRPEPRQSHWYADLEVDDPGRGPEEGYVRLVCHPAPSRRDHRCRLASQLLGQFPLQGAEGGLAALLENLANGQPLPPFDLLIEVHEWRAQRFGEQWTNGALPRTGETDEHQMRRTRHRLGRRLHPPMRWSMRAR